MEKEKQGACTSSEIMIHGRRPWEYKLEGNPEIYAREIRGRDTKLWHILTVEWNIYAFSDPSENIYVVVTLCSKLTMLSAGNYKTNSACCVHRVDGELAVKEETGSFWEDKIVTNIMIVVMAILLYILVNLYCTLKIGRIYFI